MAGIALQTAVGTDVRNEQEAHRLPGELAAFQATFAQKWQPVGCVMLASSMLRYNCHGMTLAGRRTWIDDSKLVAGILDDDGYREVPAQETDPGDLVVYFDDRGLAQHSGVVIDRPSQTGNLLPMPRILSKWGKGYEVLHWANQCPYELRFIRYYKLKTETVKKP